MIEEGFSGRGMVALEKGLEALALRHRVIANNMANVNTPGFRKSEVSFAQALSRYLDRATGPGRVSEVFTPKVFQVTSTTQRLDGNNVDVEEEMAHLAENTLLYEAVARQLSHKLTVLRLAISEGRR